MRLMISNKKNINVIEAKSFFRKLIGLMGQKNINFGVIFFNTNSIHTFFMKENIDVIGLDKNNVIIYKKENVSPNKIIIIKNKAKKTRVLELPNNSSKNFNIGEKLSFIGK